MKFVHGLLYKTYIIERLIAVLFSARFKPIVMKLCKSVRPTEFAEFVLARHEHCEVYFGARETVGESSVSSGCWGEDSDHEYEWARALPRLRPFAFLGSTIAVSASQINFQNQLRDTIFGLNSGTGIQPVIQAHDSPCADVTSMRLLCFISNEYQRVSRSIRLI
jgi:hypothetical protein